MIISVSESSLNLSASSKKEFGDFQTPLPLARRVISLIDSLVGTPERVIEPTAGLGAFLEAAHEKWGSAAVYSGYEISPDHVMGANSRLLARGIVVEQQDFFQADWRGTLSSDDNEKVLIVGNPPWVTNAELGSLGSNNLPKKTNFQGLRGFDAKTGKANFDIAEWMLIRLIEALPSSGTLAMLCKTTTARKVLRHFWKADGGGRSQASLFRIDAKAHFDVAVDACLFFVRGSRRAECNASVYEGLDTRNKLAEFGLVDGGLVSDLPVYQELLDLDGGSPYTWRSGLKHDASEVMELKLENGCYLNGFGEVADIEPECIFPLLKSSDLGNGRTIPRRFVLVTQHGTGDETEILKEAAPKTWSYLEAHASKLDERRSSIYQKRPRFCMFGIGAYSFAPWKVAISGLYDSFRFVVAAPVNGRPVMVDDTCYSIACESKEEAHLIAGLLNSDVAQRFLRSLIFSDSKRPLTVDVLRRISLVSLARRLGCLEELIPYLKLSGDCKSSAEPQMQLIM